MNTAATITNLPPLQPILAELGIPARDLARAADLSRSAASRLVAHGQLPVRRASEVRQRVVAFLKSRGASMAAAVTWASGTLLVMVPEPVGAGT